VHRILVIGLLSLLPFFGGSKNAFEPTIQVTSLTVDSRTPSSINLSWTAGNGANTIIVARQGSAVTGGDPVDNTAYTAGDFGDGTEIGTSNFVVASTSGTSATITGLVSGTTYHFAAYSFDTGGSPDPDYLVTSPATANATTGQTYYSYQSGDAGTAGTWTTDASGATQVNGAVPGSSDDVVVLLNRTVTISSNNFDLNNVTVNNQGTLALGTTTDHDYATLSGTGLITSGATHPTVTTNNFATTSGGTFEYVTAATSFTITDAAATTYNNLIIDNSSVTVGLNLTVNGTLTLENSATLTLANDGTSRAFSFNNIVVNSGNTISTNSTSATHTAMVTGNITNEGTIDFTAQSSAEYTSAPSVGVVEVTFSGTSAQTLSCSGNTDFYRLIVDKGNDQTSTLTVSSTSTSNFRIFGRNDEANTSSGDDANPTINKALWIKNGTLELGSNISIESLTEGGGDYFIPQNGALHINGASVTVTTTSNGTTNQSLNLVGKLQITSGSYSGSNTGGITYAGNAELDIDGGSLTISQLRMSSTTIGTENALSYNQSSGTVSVNNGGTNSSSEARFDMEAANVTSSRNSFAMSGGTLTVSDPNTVAGISIITRDSDFSVTGGTIVAEVTGATNFGIAVSGALNNLTVQEDGDGSTGDIRTADDGPITTTALDINGDLTLSTNAVLTMNNDDLSVGGNFSIGTGTTFTPGSNALTFDGSGAQAITVDGTITSGLNNLTIDKSAESFTPSAALTILGDLTITSGTFADGGFAHQLSGNLSNSAIHSGSGSISLVGTSTQSIGGDGNGVFQNLTLFNTNGASAPISASANFTVNGTLTFSNDKLFNLGTNTLTLGSSASTSGESSSRYIQTSGLTSDGGVTRTYGTTGSFTWPIGTSNGYTPATINVAGASGTGTINIIPVESEHPNVTTTGSSLTYYWQVSSSGFSGLSSVTHTYTYLDSDIVGTETDYVYGRFNNSNNQWTSGAAADVDESTNTIGGTGNLSSVDFIDGDFTAGDNDPSNPFGTVTIFYSRSSAPNITTTGADWDTDDSGNKTTWSTTSHAGAAATQLPESVQGAQVIIADGHIVDVSSNSKSVAITEITGTLDLGTSTGHNFGIISGTGNMIITSSGGAPVFPGGTADAFLGSSGGTVTYTNAGLFIQNLPTSPTTYHNLTLEAGITGFPGFGINFPAVDLTIHNNLTISDGASATTTSEVFLADGTTINIGNDLVFTQQNAQSVVLEFGDGAATTLNITDDINIASGTTFQVDDSGSPNDNTININGSFINNGTLDFVPSSGQNIDVNFTGSASESITGTGATTTFGDVTINKGSDISTELNVNATDFSLESLTLTNGTFRLTSAQTVAASTTSLSIPSTARLATSGGTITIGTGADDANDLFLSGELEIVSGTVEIGNASNSNNNDIEYASTGSPTIDIQGGTLTVNGQIRRPTSSTLGNLIYSQSAGTVNINGQNAQTTRAMLELANSSSFTMSAGTINIIRGGGTTFNDLYLRPSTSSISGGTIVFTPGTAGNQSYTLNSSVTLNDVTVTGNGGSNTATVTVNDQALTLNTLTLSEANSTFNANGFDLNITGDLSNSGTYTSGSNTTTFNGTGAQALTMNTATSFNNLAVNKSSGTLTASGSSDASISSDLTLTSGTLEDGGRTFTITGDITNNATHTSGTIGTGGLSLTDADHQISGSGTFGNITLVGDNRTTTVNGAITLNADLDFTNNTVFDIGSNALTFGSEATITGSSFSSLKMIRTAQDNAIVKNFPASATDFTFPIGIGSDYTPVRTNLTANSATGSITVNTYNERHPLTTSSSDLELLRYWTVETSGLSGTGTLVFNYVDADVQGTESNYFGGQVVNANWSPINGTEFDDAPTNSIRTVDPSANTITYSGISTSNLTGEYTAGETAEFATVSIYYSRDATLGGNWENGNSWSITGHDGAAAGSTPDGNRVEIADGHTITATADTKSSFSLVLNGTLDLGTTVGHDFGTITGTGTMDIEATTNNNFNFPASDITSYTGTHQFSGTTNGNMLNTPSAFYNLSFAGTSIKNLENTSFTITNDFSMSAGTVNQTTSSTVQLGGSFSNTGATYSDTAGTLEFNGSGAQSITASGGSTTFNNLSITNTAGTVTLNDNVDMNGALVQSASTTLDLDDKCIGGTGSVTINGIIQTSNANGLSGGATTTFENTLSAVTINAGSNVVYDATGAQTVTARTDYDGLQVDGSGTKSLDGSATVASALNIAAGDLSIGSNTLTLNGTVTGAGEISGTTTSNISVGGTGDLGTIDFASGSANLGTLTVNRTSSGTVTFEDDFTVNSSIDLTEGIVNLPDNGTVTLGSSGNPATITGGNDNSYFNTDLTDDDLDNNPEIDFFLESTDLTIPIGYNPLFSMSISCPSCSGHRFRARVSRGPYNTPPRSGGRETNNVVRAQWSLQLVSGAAPVDVTVTLRWIGSFEGSGLGTDVGVSIYDTNLGSPFWDINSTVSPKSGSNPYSQSRTFSVTGTNKIYLAIANRSSPLPVNLISFNGKMNPRGDIDLNWQTADEENNSHFEVERSGNGMNDWQTLDFVEGNGNSNQLKTYTFTDNKVNKDKGYIFYRLRQVDFSGDFEYSPVISIPIRQDIVSLEKSWSVYPNPAERDDINIVLTNAQFDSQDVFKFRVFDLNGKVLYQNESAAYKSIPEIQKCLMYSQSGLYFIEIGAKESVERHRIILK